MKPWEDTWFVNADGDVVNQNGDTVARVEVYGADKWLAAAPELYRALEAVVYEYRMNFDPPLSPALELADKAVAKVME